VREDADALAAAMARAFSDDPPLVWVLRSPATRERRIRQLFKTTLRTDALGNHVTATVDVATAGDRIVGGAIWYPPGHWPTPAARQLAALPGFIWAFGRSLGRATALVRGVATVHPQRPHWYLAGIGVEPDWQGHGVGAALLRSRLRVCDAAHADAYLESSKVTNIRFYQHFGFETRRLAPVPTGAPPITPMWRSAADRDG
jgi:ribosomal protein S18 acetylase RimI-like enzyme